MDLAELIDVPETLEGWVVGDGHFRGRQANQSPDRNVKLLIRLVVGTPHDGHIWRRWLAGRSWRSDVRSRHHLVWLWLAGRSRRSDVRSRHHLVWLWLWG